jgi:hypothetical protein
MERDNLGNLGIDEAKMTKVYLKEIAGDNVGWIDLSEKGQMAGCCERCNESLCFTNCKIGFLTFASPCIIIRFK